MFFALLDVSPSFTDNFGYDNKEIKGQNFSILFTEKDKQINKPRLELKMLQQRGRQEMKLYNR
ncbi:MAG: PAS domain S-box protein, partial [Chitinophagaceae bacterium]